MTIYANVAFCKDDFVAELSDGRRIEQRGFREMAHALHGAGVHSNGVQYEWHAGQRMITAGQQVALRAELRRLEREYGGLSIAA